MCGGSVVDCADPMIVRALLLSTFVGPAQEIQLGSHVVVMKHEEKLCAVPEDKEKNARYIE